MCQHCIKVRLRLLWSVNNPVLNVNAAFHCVKVQRIRTMRSEKGGYYHQTYVVVPRHARKKMGLAAGSTAFLSAASPRSMAVLRKRRHADDRETTLVESVAYRYKGEPHTVLKMTIPEKLVRSMNIEKGYQADFVCTGSGCLINFRKRNKG